MVTKRGLAHAALSLHCLFKVVYIHSCAWHHENPRKVSMKRSGHTGRRQGDGRRGRGRSERECLHWWWQVCWCCWQRELRTLPRSEPGRTYIDSVWLRPAVNLVVLDGWRCFQLVTLLPGTKRCPPYTSTGRQNHSGQTKKTAAFKCFIF